MGSKRVAGLVGAAALALVASASGANGNGRIAYVSGGSIYVADPAGGAPTLLRAGFDPAYSPDGTKIAYGDAPGGNVFVADADGSKAVLVASDHVVGPLAWSPDGTRIAYASWSSTSGFAVSVAKADGSGSSVVARDASWNAARPTWSPDGTQLAFTTTNDVDIAVVNADGSGRRLLIQDSTQDKSPSWSPDGSRIAFLRGDFGSFVLYTIRPDGSGLRQVGVTPADPDSQPAWSPDSSQLVFGARQFVVYTKVGPDYRYDVYSVAADGTGERRLGDGSYPAYAPDGRRIVFTSIRRRSYVPQLFVMNADGSCQTQLTSAGAAVSA